MLDIRIWCIYLFLGSENWHQRSSLPQWTNMLNMFYFCWWNFFTYLILDIVPPTCIVHHFYLYTTIVFNILHWAMDITIIYNLTWDLRKIENYVMYQDFVGFLITIALSKWKQNFSTWKSDAENTYIAGGTYKKENTRENVMLMCIFVLLLIIIIFIFMFWKKCSMVKILFFLSNDHINSIGLTIILHSKFSASNWWRIKTNNCKFRSASWL